ncbi:MAG: hypothetical protein GY861_05330 [bacterium]|nr:hypothetical protein [bacterium]
MEFRRSTVSGCSSARSGSNERNISQERQPYSKLPLSQKPIQSVSSGSERHPESKIVQTIVKTTDNQQIIKEKIYTMILKGQPFSYEDVSPGVSITQDPQGNITLKETRLRIVDQQQQPIGEEDAGSNDGNCSQPTR